MDKLTSLIVKNCYNAFQVSLGGEAKGDSVRGIVLTTAPTLLAGILLASPAWAVSTAVAPVAGATTTKLIPYAANAFSFSDQALNVGIAGALASSSGVTSAYSSNTYISNFTNGIQVELAQGRNWSAFGDLTPAQNALTSTSLSGASTFAGATFALSDDLGLSFGRANLDFAGLNASQPASVQADLANGVSAGTTSATLNWNFSDWGALGIGASRSTGNGALLGVINNGMPGFAETTTLGISARVGFGEGWVTTLSYTEGVSQLDLRSRDQLIGKLDPIRSQSYGISFAKQGLFGADAFGIAVSRPLQVFGGDSSLGAISSNLGLATQQAQESDVALGYVTTFLDGTVALQANAAYQLNAAGTRGQNAVTGLARAKLNF